MVFQVTWDVEATVHSNWELSDVWVNMFWHLPELDFIIGNTRRGPKLDGCRNVEHLSQEIFPPKRRHIIKVSTCLLHCLLIWLHQNQMGLFMWAERALSESKSRTFVSFFFLITSWSIEDISWWKCQGNWVCWSCNTLRTFWLIQWTAFADSTCITAQ